MVTCLVLRRVQQDHRVILTECAQLIDPFRFLIKLGEVTTFEFVPAGRVMAEPPAEAVARRNVLPPFYAAQPVFADPARP